MKKRKIVWLCSFANKEIADLLGSEKHLFVSPWITDLIELFRKREDIELSIISPNYYENKFKYFLIDNIKVYLYQYRPWYLPFEAYNLSYNYKIAQNSILKIIAGLNPDLVHLHGAENPLYSTAALALMDENPVLITLQGFVFLSSKKRNPLSNFIRWNRIRIEKKINTQGRYFTVATDDVVKNLKIFNKNASYFYDHYPTAKPKIAIKDSTEKKYDVVYFARISRDKGIEDLIEAVKILKIKHEHIKVIVIGGGNANYVRSLKMKIEKEDLHHAIHFAGFLPTQEDVFKLASQARVSVLPTYFDGVPGSIREAMAMKIPVVAYAVGGIPSLNDEKECLTLVEKRNIPELAEKIELVLNDNARTNKIVENAFDMVNNKYDNDKIYQNLITIYNKILNDHEGQKT